MNKRGGSAFSSFVAFAVIVIGMVVLLWFFGAFDSSQNFSEKVGLDTIGEKISQTQSFVYVGTGENNALRPLDYIFGEIPVYLIELTGGSTDQNISAAIIVIGIWFLLFLSFADIVKIFSTFNSAVSWVAAGVLTIIAANVNIVKAISVFMLVITSGFGAFSVFAGLIGAFVVFVGIQFGSNALREFALRRKADEMRMRAMMGSTRAAIGAKQLAEVEKAFERSKNG